MTARVVIVSYSPIARDPRVLRQVRLLSQSYDVVTVGYGPAPDGVTEHIEIPEHLTAWRSNKFVLLALYLLRMHGRLYFGAERTKFVQRAVPRGSMDAVLANDALGVPVALSLAPRGGVHADLHEFAPRQGSTWQWRALVAPFMRWACRVARGAESMTTVAPGIAEEYRKRFDLLPQVVPNAAPFRPELEPTVLASPVRLVHIGIGGRARKLEVMIDAVAEVERRQPGSVTFDLILAPGDQTYLRELAERAERVPGGVVRVLPPVVFDQIVPTLAGYDVGVFICPPTTFNLEHALPNKFFEFIQARLAIVVGPSPEMAPLVREHGLGVVADGFNVRATADALAGLTQTDVVRFKEAAHAHAFELSAGELSRPWEQAIASLVARAQSRPQTDPAGPTTGPTQ